MSEELMLAQQLRQISPTEGSIVAIPQAAKIIRRAAAVLERRASPAPPTTEGREEVYEAAKRIVDWDDAGRLADDEWLVERNETAIIAICRALLSSPRVEEVRREALEEAAARGMCRARILSNLIHDGRQEGQEWIQKAEDMGWEFYKWDASVAINRLEQDGYAFTKRSEASLPNTHGE